VGRCLLEKYRLDDRREPDTPGFEPNAADRLSGLLLRLDLQEKPILGLVGF
jgi:hypothetical protein